MAGIKKETIGTAENANTFLYNLVAAVGKEDIEWPDAQKRLRVYFSELSETDQAEWRKRAVPSARHLMQVAEAFSQELTVLASNQTLG